MSGSKVLTPDRQEISIDMQISQLFQVIKHITPTFRKRELRDFLPMVTESKLKRGEHLVSAGNNFRQINFIVKGPDACIMSTATETKPIFYW